MKKILRNCLLILFSIIALSFSGCSVSDVGDVFVIKKYSGTWYCYKIETEGETIDLRNPLSALMGLEVSIEISTDKTYVLHYVKDHEGTFSVSDNSLLLSGDVSGSAEISESDMIITLSYGSKLYCQRDSL